MGKKKTTRPSRYLQLVPTPPELENRFKLDQKASDELKALIKKIANYGKRATEEDPQPPQAA